MRVVFVHGACVRDGGWWWRHAARLLEQDGISSTSPALPSCGETERPVGTAGPGLSDDVASVRAVLESSDEPAVVVFHSYGGMVVAEAAAGLAQVAHLVGVASFLPLPGEALVSFGDGTPAPYLDFAEDGTFGLHGDALTETFLHDCDPADIAPAHARLIRQSSSVAAQPVAAAAWQDIPTTYVVCALDRGTPPELQRAQAQRAGRVIEADAGHHAFMSQPAIFRGVVARAAELP